jgi:serine/threonine-protein kinase RsbW
VAEAHSETSLHSETVQLIIPCRPEYVGVARLAILGIASRMPFSYDEVEDVRLAVGEACTHAVERAGTAAASIRIVSTINSHALKIEVSDDVPSNTIAAPTEESRLLEEAGVDHKDLGALLMEILVDDVTIDTDAAGTRVVLTKYAPE